MATLALCWDLNSTWTYNGGWNSQDTSMESLPSSIISKVKVPLYSQTRPFQDMGSLWAISGALVTSTMVTFKWDMNP